MARTQRSEIELNARYYYLEHPKTNQFQVIHLQSDCFREWCVIHAGGRRGGFVLAYSKRHKTLKSGQRMAERLRRQFIRQGYCEADGLSRRDWQVA